MKKVSVIIESKSGLHARPASTFVACAQKFDSEINLEKDGNTINAKSIIGILGLGVSSGDEITIIADGQDEADAVLALEKLVKEELVHQ
jgi:phosphotransferase system HPr (HPr) family protein